MKNITYKAPKNNKEVFIDHAIDRIPDLAHENQQKVRGFKFEVNGIPFQILREKTREELLSMATDYTTGIQSLLQKCGSETCLYVRGSNQRDASWHREQNKLSGTGKGLSRDYETIRDISIIQTGHEPILYYPGVWIKNHLTQYLAKRMGGVGVNMIVDNDACNMGFVYAPILSEDSATVQKVALVDGMDGVAYEEIVVGSPERMLAFKKEIINLLKTDAPDEKKIITFESVRVAFEEFIDRCMNIYYQGCTDMVGLLTTEDVRWKRISALIILKSLFPGYVKRMVSITFYCISYMRQNDLRKSTMKNCQNTEAFIKFGQKPTPCQI